MISPFVFLTVRKYMSIPQRHDSKLVWSKLSLTGLWQECDIVMKDYSTHNLITVQGFNCQTTARKCFVSCSPRLKHERSAFWFRHKRTVEGWTDKICLCRLLIQPEVSLSWQTHVELLPSPKNCLCFPTKTSFRYYSFISIVCSIYPQVWGNIVITELYKDHYKQVCVAAWS